MLRLSRVEEMKAETCCWESYQVRAANFCSWEDAYTTSYYCGETDEFTSNL